jgi:hypothetical protein
LAIYLEVLSRLCDLKRFDELISAHYFVAFSRSPFTAQVFEALTLEGNLLLVAGLRAYYILVYEALAMELAKY